MRRLLILPVLLIPWAAMAGPPSAGGVCDELKGNTPGLYGLCVAYCEAQDLGDPEVTAGKQSAFSLLAAYERKRGPEDPDMPCLAQQLPPPPDAECPCWNSQALMDGLPSPTSCFSGAEYMNVFQETASGGKSADLAFPVVFLGRFCSVNYDVSAYDKKPFVTELDDAAVEGCRSLLGYHMSVVGCPGQ